MKLKSNQVDLSSVKFHSHSEGKQKQCFSRIIQAQRPSLSHSPIAKVIYPSQEIWKSCDRPTDRPSAPQAYQCLLSHFVATLGAQEEADCTSMLFSIDSCQNRVSADQYHLTVSRAQVSTHQGRVFFEVIRCQFICFQMIAGSRPVSPDRIAGSDVEPSRLIISFQLSAYKLSNDRRLKFIF